MSAAELIVVGSPPRTRVSTRFLRSELKIIFGRRRNIAGLGVLAAVPVILAVAARLSSSDQVGGPAFISAIVGNGLFVAFGALALELPLFLPLAVSAIQATQSPARPTSARCVICSRSRLAVPDYW
jgi:ABC-2 type transport system permease protein